MSNTRTMSWLASLIVLLILAHLFLDMRGSGISRIARRGTIAPGADVASAISVKYEGKPSLVLSKASGEWRLVSPFRARADRQAVLALLDGLAFTPILDSMDDSELRKLDRRRQDFGLQPPVLEVETLGANGVEKVAFGGSTPMGDGVYAVVEGENVVFVVPTNVFAAADKSFDGFRSHALCDIAADEVGAFDIRLAAGTFFRFIRSGDKWRMTEPSVAAASAQKVNKFITAILDARAEGFAWPVGATNEMETASASLLAGYGLDPDSAVTLTFKGVDGIDHQVSFGRDAEKGFVYALALNGSAIVTIDSSLKDMLVSDVSNMMDKRLFPVEASAVSSISIQSGDAQCILAKGPDGEWRIDAPVSAPADKVAVDGLIGRLLSLNTQDQDMSGVKVSLGPDVEPAYVPSTAILDGFGFERFRSCEMLDIAPSQVRRLVVTKDGAKPTAVIYDANRRVWDVEASEVGGVADTEAIEAILSAITPLKAVEVVTLRATQPELAKYGLENPAYTIAIDRVQADAIRRNIRIGEVSGSGRYATVGSLDAVFLIPEETVKKFIAPIVR